MGHMGPTRFLQIVEADPHGMEAERVRRVLPGLYASVLARIAERGAEVSPVEPVSAQTPTEE